MVPIALVEARAQIRERLLKLSISTNSMSGPAIRELHAALDGFRDGRRAFRAQAKARRLEEKQEGTA